MPGFQIADIRIAGGWVGKLRTHLRNLGCITHMHNRPTVVRSNFHSGVSSRSRGASNQNPKPDPFGLQHPHICDHLVQRRSDQTGEPDEIGLLTAHRFENDVHVHHHAEIDHPVSVTSQHHPHDILSDVVNITLYRGDHKGSG
ncbi:MAG: hypothetical protein BWY82_01208 [Verrucomicrobia bacterium ADurb.Bin474]|nr:MAG: hypothetical protein BWY82_01208 [Verrucomicrobia bacterium ADurb.Bin474]